MAATQTGNRGPLPQNVCGKGYATLGNAEVAMRLFILIYWLGIVAEIVIRAPYQKLRKGAGRAQVNISTTEKVLLGLLFFGMGLVPLLYSVTDWLAFADYQLPLWLGWVGVALLIGALILFALSHRDLQANWSPSLEIYTGHTLITNGIYRHLRHPMYASQWVWVMAQILLLQNWIAGPINLLVFLPFYFLRVRAEEQMLLATFGEQYRAYMARTGRVLPKLLRTAA